MESDDLFQLCNTHVYSVYRFQSSQMSLLFINKTAGLYPKASSLYFPTNFLKDNSLFQLLSSISTLPEALRIQPTYKQ